MDGEKQHHLRELLTNTASNNRIRDLNSLSRRIHRRVFPRGVGFVLVFAGNVVSDRSSDGFDCVRICGDEQRRRRVGVRQGV